MKITLILARSGHLADSPWVVDAFDQYTLEENPAALEEGLRKARALHSDDNVALGSIEVPSTFLRDCFEPHTVQGH